MLDLRLQGAASLPFGAHLLIKPRVPSTWVSNTPEPPVQVAQAASRACAGSFARLAIPPGEGTVFSGSVGEFGREPEMFTHVLVRPLPHVEQSQGRKQKGLCGRLWPGIGDQVPSAFVF